MLQKVNRSRNFRGYYFYVLFPIERAVNIDTNIPCVHNIIKLRAFTFHTKIIVLVLQGFVILLGGN